ncbi:MAG: Maf family protein [Candidatus Competibacterales bacterium]|nr:Maf family protein [Candidatus Competibacterales bacterium]
MSLPVQLYLASASPRRRELLDSLGLRVARVVAPVDETPRPGESPEDYVCRLALAKARAGQVALGGAPPGGEAPVLGADTTVVLEGAMLGKPGDREEGLAMLARLSDREHLVWSGVAVVRGEREAVCSHCSRVRFRALTSAERAAYWATGEPADKAGAYGIQGLGAMFVRELHGSHSGVMGLPLYETAELLQAFAIDILASSSGTGLA